MTVHHVDSGVDSRLTLCCQRPTGSLPLADYVTSTEHLVSCDGSRPEPDEQVCEDCRGRNVVWWADSDRWNHVTASLPTGRGAILCPSCFVRLWEEATGLTAVWHLTPTHIKAAESGLSDGEFNEFVTATGHPEAAVPVTDTPAAPAGGEELKTDG